MHKYFFDFKQPTVDDSHYDDDDKKNWWFWVVDMTWEVGWVLILDYHSVYFVCFFKCWLNRISNLRFGRPDGRYRVDPVLHMNIRPIQFRSGSNDPRFLSLRGPRSPLDSCLCPRRNSRRTPSRRRWSRWCPCRDANVRTHDCQSWERRPPK